MEHHDQREKEAEEAIASINKRTGRNMPQAIATAAALVAVILACLLIRIDLFVVLIVVFMMLALWELRVDFATAGLHIPVVTLWLCSAATLLATCSGDLKDCVPYTSPERKAWKGRTMAVVKSGKTPGEVTLTVKGKGLKKASVSLNVN